MISMIAIFIFWEKKPECSIKIFSKRGDPYEKKTKNFFFEIS
jgi:hypothetical protein